MPQSLNLLDQEIDVWPGGGRVGDDHAKEVDLISLWLVTHHRSARLHHHCFDLRSHLLQKKKKKKVQNDQNTNLPHHLYNQPITLQLLSALGM